MKKLIFLGLVLFSTAVFSANQQITSNKMELRCTPVGSMQVTYTFYIKDVSGLPSRINISAKTDCEFSTNVKSEWLGTTKEIFVRAKSAQGVESDNSNSISIDFIGPPPVQTKPDAPIMDSVTEVTL